MPRESFKLKCGKRVAGLSYQAFEGTTVSCSRVSDAR